MYVITFKFLNGCTGTLSHSDASQIREWVSIFGSPEGMKECNIAEMSVTKNKEKVSTQAA